MSNSWRPHRLQHTRFPVHHQFPELMQTHVHRISDAIQPSHPLSSPSPPAFNLSQHQGLFQWVSSSHQVVKVLEFQLQHQSFQWIFRTDFLQDWMVWSLCSPRDSQESPPSTQFISINSSVFSLFLLQILPQYMTTGKTIVLTRQAFVGKVMSVFFTIRSRLVIAFLLGSKHLLISCLQSPSAMVLEPKKIKFATVSIFPPSICNEMLGPDAMILIFWMLSLSQLFHSPLSLSSRGSSVPLHFLPEGWCHLHIWD